MTVTQGIGQCFAQRLKGYLQLFFTAKPPYDTTLVQMLEQKRQTRIEQFEEIAVDAHIVDKITLFCATKTRHPEQKLGIILRPFGEECRSGILNLSVLNHRKFVE